MANQYIDTNYLFLFPINKKDSFQLIENNIINELDLFHYFPLRSTKKVN